MDRRPISGRQQHEVRVAGGGEEELYRYLLGHINLAPTRHLSPY